MEEIKETYDEKYMREILEFWDAYMFALINEIYVGVGINLGMSEKDAYKLAKTRPGDMQKAKFFSSIFDKFKGIFNYKVPKFRYGKKLFTGDGKPMTPEQWDKFSGAIDTFWSDRANKVAEDIVIKSYMLGRETTKYQEKKKPYENKSLYQVSEDQFDGKIPDSITEAYKNYDFKNSEKKIINRSLSNIGMYVAKTNNEIQNAIRHQVSIGMDQNLSPVETASNLYHQVENDPNLNNKYTAEALKKDWNRIAATEQATIFTEATLAPLEGDAMESMKDPNKSIYVVRIGGSCDYCQNVQGTIMRLIPSDVADPSTNKLSDIGIKDANTAIYTYIGQSNVGRKQKDWFPTVPAHPWNKASLQKINIKDEWYNPKTGDVERRQVKDKHIPQQKDYNYRSEEEKKERKPHYISENKVQYNGNIYEAVSPESYNEALERHRKNPAENAIPVNSSSPSYKRIFGEAEKYG